MKTKTPETQPSSEKRPTTYGSEHKYKPASTTHAQAFPTKKPNKLWQPNAKNCARDKSVGNAFPKLHPGPTTEDSLSPIAKWRLISIVELSLPNQRLGFGHLNRESSLSHYVEVFFSDHIKSLPKPLPPTQNQPNRFPGPDHRHRSQPARHPRSRPPACPSLQRTVQAAPSGFSVARVAQVSFWLAYMHLLLMLCPNTKFLTPPKDRSLRQRLPLTSMALRMYPLPAGAAAGCDLLIFTGVTHARSSRQQSGRFPRQSLRRNQRRVTGHGPGRVPAQRSVGVRH